MGSHVEEKLPTDQIIFPFTAGNTFTSLSNHRRIHEELQLSIYEQQNVINLEKQIFKIAVQSCIIREQRFSPVVFSDQYLASCSSVSPVRNIIYTLPR